MSLCMAVVYPVPVLATGLEPHSAEGQLLGHRPCSLRSSTTLEVVDGVTSPLLMTRSNPIAILGRNAMKPFRGGQFEASFKGIWMPPHGASFLDDACAFGFASAAVDPWPPLQRALQPQCSGGLLQKAAVCAIETGLHQSFPALWPFHAGIQLV